MKTITADVINEQLAEAAFSRQSVVFDQLYSGNTIVNYKRERVRRHVMQHLAPGGSILELNAGTGEDAIFFAQQGFRVHATDISVGMQEELKRKVEVVFPHGQQASGSPLERGGGVLYRLGPGVIGSGPRYNTALHPSQEGNRTSPGFLEDIADRSGVITTELCSFTALHQLQNKGPFDLIFSNFAGLNCTDELDKVLASFNGLLNPGGMVTLVILPKFCIWETLLVFKGKFKTAFRRFFSKNGRAAHVEGVHFKCWYYNPSYIVKRLKDKFELIGIEGLCTLVPPSYIEGFAEKHPRVYQFLKAKEDRLKSRRPWRSVGDYYIISLKKK